MGKSSFESMDQPAHTTLEVVAPPRLFVTKYNCLFVHDTRDQCCRAQIDLNSIRIPEV